MAKVIIVPNTTAYQLIVNFGKALTNGNRVAMQDAIVALKLIKRETALLLFEQYQEWENAVKAAEEAEVAKEQQVAEVVDTQPAKADFDLLYTRFTTACKEGRRNQAAGYLSRIKEQYTDCYVEAKALLDQTFAVPAKEAKAELKAEEIVQKFHTACAEKDQRVAAGCMGELYKAFPTERYDLYNQFRTAFPQSKSK